MARSLVDICGEIRKDWHPMNYAAKPYFDAMRQLDSINDNYGADTGKSCVLYFLSNATTWRGETARRVKKELKTMAGLK